VTAAFVRAPPELILAGLREREAALTTSVRDPAARCVVQPNPEEIMVARRAAVTDGARA
jgi:hypothetical protein